MADTLRNRTTLAVSALCVAAILGAAFVLTRAPQTDDAPQSFEQPSAPRTIAEIEDDLGGPATPEPSTEPDYLTRLQQIAGDASANHWTTGPDEQDAARRWCVARIARVLGYSERSAAAAFDRAAQHFDYASSDLIDAIAAPMPLDTPQDQMRRQQCAAAFYRAAI